MKALDYIVQQDFAGQDARFARLRNYLFDGPLADYHRFAPTVQLMAVQTELVVLRVTMSPSDGGPRTTWSMIRVRKGWTGPVIDLLDQSPDATLQDVHRMRTFARDLLTAEVDTWQLEQRGVCRK